MSQSALSQPGVHCMRNEHIQWTYIIYKAKIAQSIDCYILRLSISLCAIWLRYVCSKHDYHSYYFLILCLTTSLQKEVIEIEVIEYHNGKKIAKTCQKY